MAFALNSPKLSGRPAQTPKIFAETPNVLEIPVNFVEIREIFEKREMLTLSRDSRYFCLRTYLEPNG
jgi:hypothetical protein